MSVEDDSFGIPGCAVYRHLYALAVHDALCLAVGDVVAALARLHECRPAEAGGLVCRLPADTVTLVAVEGRKDADVEHDPVRMAGGSNGGHGGWVARLGEGCRDRGRRRLTALGVMARATV